MVAQVILFEIDCAIFYTNLHGLFCKFISWTNWVNSGKFMDNCWISCQFMAVMKKVYDDLIIINLYIRCFLLFRKHLQLIWVGPKLKKDLSRSPICGITDRLLNSKFESNSYQIEGKKSFWIKLFPVYFCGIFE